MFTPSIVDPAATRTCPPTQAQGYCTKSIRGSEAAAPVETAGPPPDRRHPPVRRSLLPQVHAGEERNRPSGDQRGPALPGSECTAKSGWKGRGGPPSAATRKHPEPPRGPARVFHVGDLRAVGGEAGEQPAGPRPSSPRRRASPRRRCRPRRAPSGRRRASRPGRCWAASRRPGRASGARAAAGSRAEPRCRGAPRRCDPRRRRSASRRPRSWGRSSARCRRSAA